MLDLILVLALGVGFGLAATWTTRLAARAFGLVDRPDGRRKHQTQPVALAGGVSVLLSSIATLVVAAVLRPDVAETVLLHLEQGLALVAAGSLIVLVGLLDDKYNLRARHKLAGQLAAVLILIYAGGFVIDDVSLLGGHLPLGYAAVPVTVFWFLAAINAMNLLDGMDGLLGTIAIIVVASLAWMAFAVGNPFVGWVAVALAGGLLGFLRFNLPPASVYLGDAGSMLLGLFVGALAIGASLKGPTVSIVAPAVLLVLPILDTSAAIVRRKLTGRGLAIGDRGHLHHVLQRKGLNRHAVLALVAGLGGMAAVGALVGSFLQNDFFALLSAAAVVTILVTTGLFGTAEVRLVRERARAVYRAAVGRQPHVELAVRIQGTADWSEVWQRLVLAANELLLESVRLDVNAPAWHEAFHGRWDRRTTNSLDGLDTWTLEVPVVGHDQVIGRLSVSGIRAFVPLTDQIAELCTAVAEAEALATRATPQPATIPYIALPIRPVRASA